MRRYLPFFLTSGTVFALDQVSKALVRAAVIPFHPVEVLDGLFRITFVMNRGALFGLGQGLSHLFLLVSALVLLLICFYLPKVKTTTGLVSFGLLAGGAAGNLADRLRFGAVVDFFDFGYRGWRWPAFNVADAAITVGVGLLLLRSLRSR